MKRYFLTGVVALLVIVVTGSVVFGGAKRIVKYNGQITDTLVASDSITRLSSKIAILNTVGDKNFDELVMGFNVPNMTDISTNAGEGIVDSVIIRLLMGTGANVDTVATWTDTLPATFTMRYSAPIDYKFRQVTDTSTSAGDSIIVLLQDSTSTGFFNDLFWFSIYAVDTAGSSAGDSLQYVVTWWAKFIEAK